MLCNTPTTVAMSSAFGSMSS